MPNKPATQQQLLAENEGLRGRLAQTEAILREMRSGKVDALVVSDLGGAQLFAPENADQSFRILVGEMIEGALTMTAEGVIVYANRRLAGMLKTPLEKVIGSTLRTWIAPGSQTMLQSLLDNGAAEERRGELSLAASDGTVTPVYLSVSNLPVEGRPDAYCLVAVDLTEHNRIEAVAASERVARQLLAVANQSRGELLREIEDRTRAEVALRIAEQQQQQLVENLEIERSRLVHAQRIAKIGSWETTQPTRSTHWSDETHRIYETDPATFHPNHQSFISHVKISAVEYQLIQGHAQAGCDVLKSVEFPWPVAQVALQHHERMNGSGYPQGLKGEAILFEARIMAVADVVEAMSSHRPYRPGLGIEAALAEIERGRETAYDPVVVDACTRLFREKAYVMPA